MLGLRDDDIRQEAVPGPTGTCEIRAYTPRWRCPLLLKRSFAAGRRSGGEVMGIVRVEGCFVFGVRRREFV